MPPCIEGKTLLYASTACICAMADLINQISQLVNTHHVVFLPVHGVSAYFNLVVEFTWWHKLP